MWNEELVYNFRMHYAKTKKKTGVARKLGGCGNLHLILYGYIYRYSLRLLEIKPIENIHSFFFDEILGT